MYRNESDRKQLLRKKEKNVSVRHEQDKNKIDKRPRQKRRYKKNYRPKRSSVTLRQTTMKTRNPRIFPALNVHPRAKRLVDVEGAETMKEDREKEGWMTMGDLELNQKGTRAMVPM